MNTIIKMVTIFLVGGTISTCGDLSEMDEAELRELVQRARYVARQELEKDFSKARVDALEQAIIDVLQGETTYARGECWEDGLRTTFLATQTQAVRNAGIGHAPHDGLSCTDHYVDNIPANDGVTCVSNSCSCYADGELQTNGNYETVCDVTSTSEAETNTYTKAQASVYEPSLIPDETMSSYSITPMVLGMKMPGQVFDVALLTEDEPISPAASKNLTAYNIERKAVRTALAQWKENLQDNIYDIDHATRDNFIGLFFMQAALAQGIETIGGTIDGKGIRRAYISVEGAAVAATQVLIAQQLGDDLAVILGGPVQDEFNAANKTISYLALNATGNIISRQLRKTFTRGLLEIDGSYLIRFTEGSCVPGNPVLLRMSNNSTVHETVCRSPRGIVKGQTP